MNFDWSNINFEEFKLHPKTKAFLKELNKQFSCPDHPKYQVKRKPRTLCERCWELWISKKNSDNIDVNPDPFDTYDEEYFSGRH